MEVIQILGIILAMVVFALIVASPLTNTLEVLFEPRRMSYRRANFSYTKFYAWFRRRKTIQKVCDWLVLWPLWGYLFYFVGQGQRALFGRRLS